MTRIALALAITLSLFTAHPAPSSVCTSDSACAATGIVTCPSCPDYTENLR